MGENMSKVSFRLRFLFIITLALISTNLFAKWNWSNIAEPVYHKPNFRVIKVYQGQQFAIKWDRYKNGAFIAGDAIVRFRDELDINSIVGVLNNYVQGEGLIIRSTNTVYANVHKTGTMLVYAPFSKRVTFTPDLFIDTRKNLSAWEIYSPDITNNYRISTFMTGIENNQLYPNYFSNLSLDKSTPVNYGKLKELDNARVYVVGINVDSDILSSGTSINYATYSPETLNKYYFRIFQKEKVAVDRAFANPEISENESTFGMKSVLAVFMISPSAYIDQPASVSPPSTGHYYEMDNALDIKDCHFWSYAKMFETDKYNQIKDYTGYNAIFPIGIMQYKLHRYAYPQYFTGADKINMKCAEYDTVFYNPVEKNNEKQTHEDGFVKYIYADKLTPVKR